LQVDRIESDFSWKSVIAYGTFEELEKGEANMGLEILMKNVVSSLKTKTISSLNPEQDSRQVESLAFQNSFLSPFIHSSNKEISEIVVYRIKINEMTGKFGNNS